MKNNLTILVAVLIAGALGYWAGQKQTVPVGDKNALKSLDFFTLNPSQKDMRLFDAPIRLDSAQIYTARYKDFINKQITVDTKVVQLRDIFHPVPQGASARADYPYYRIERNTINAIMGDTSIKRLCVFPAIKIGGISRKREFTLVLVGEYANYDLNKRVIYDEIELCPPPTPCRSF